MAQGYTRQSSYKEGDPLLASHTNKEFDQLDKAFDEDQGHTHSGSRGQGGLVPLISSADGLTRMEATEDSIKYYVEGVLRMTVTKDTVTFHEGLTVSGLVNGRDLEADGTKIDNLAIVSDVTAVAAPAILTRYLENAGTEQFTTAYKAKLDGISENATTDLTGTEIKTLIDNVPNTHTLTSDQFNKLSLLIDEKLEEDPAFFD